MKHLMPAAMAIAITLATASGAHARPDTRTMTCSQVVALVNQYRAIVLTTGPRTYDRIVSSFGFCGPTQKAVDARVPTMDSPSCRIGYRCEEDPFK